MLKKVLGPVKDDEQYRKRRNNELYSHIETINDPIIFCGHLQRINPDKPMGGTFQLSTET